MRALQLIDKVLQTPSNASESIPVVLSTNTGCVADGLELIWLAAFTKVDVRRNVGSKSGVRFGAHDEGMQYWQRGAGNRRRW